MFGHETRQSACYQQLLYSKATWKKETLLDGDRKEGYGTGKECKVKAVL